jgi:hypothetical protein
MRIKFLAIAAAMLLALGLSMTAGAGSITDTDSDDIPDVFDNCVTDANTSQVNTDLGLPMSAGPNPTDVYGNACDCDFDNNNDQNGLDITAMFGVFLTSSALHDMDNNGDVNGLDVVNCFGRFLTPPG